MNDTILIWGGGAIGGTLAAYWARSGEDVVLVDVVSEHVDACNRSGLQIEGPVEEFKVNLKASLPEDLVGRFSRIVLGCLGRGIGLRRLSCICRRRSLRLGSILL